MLVAEAPAVPVLLVVTHRPEFNAETRIGMPHVTPMLLNRPARRSTRRCCAGGAR
jgi:hypothetical protein